MVSFLETLSQLDFKEFCIKNSLVQYLTKHLIIISAIYTLLLSLKLILSGVKHKLRVTQVV